LLNNTIYLEKLDIKSMFNSKKTTKSLNRNISDVSWYEFVRILTYKAEEAGRELVFINPKNTSSMCSGCDNIEKKILSERMHHCKKCGLKLDRDHNAAINIRNLGLGTSLCV
jgi:putative transposase